MKRVSSVILAICIFVAVSVTTYALNTNEKTMDEDRLRIAASYFFWQDLKASDSESKWNTESDFDTPVPLYDYVGYRQYYSDYQVNYVRILDNWNDTSDKYILYDTSYSSRVVSTTTINIT